jgi:CHAT domain-containing protein/tetratricopeptide (TPR) repeat protein
MRQLSVLTLLVGLFISHLLPAQQIPQNPNKLKAGKKDGPWTILFDKKWKKTAIKDSVVYYRLITYKDGKPEGLVTDYRRSGLKQWEGYLISDEPEDIFTGVCTWYSPSGIKDSEVTFVNGKREGSMITYDSTGKLQAKGTYVNNRLEDVYYSYYPSGSLMMDQFYKNDSPQGTFNCYYESGKLLLEGNFSGKLRTGFWCRRNEDGSYDEGTLYSDSGTVVAEITTYEKVYEMATGVYDKKEYASALYLYTIAVELIKKQYETNYNTLRDYAKAQNYIAECQDNLGNMKEAEEAHMECFNSRKVIYGEKDINYGVTSFNLGYFYEIQNQYTKAFPYYKIALGITGKQKDKTYYYEFMERYAILLYKDNRYSESEIVFEELMKNTEKTKGKSNEKYANYLSFLSTIYQRTGRTLEAENRILESHRIYTSLSAPFSETRAESLNEVGMYYDNIKKYKEAETYFVQALQVLDSLRLTNIKTYSKIQVNLAGIYSKQSKFREAEVILLRNDSLLNANPQTSRIALAQSNSELGSLYFDKADFKKSEIYQIKGLKLIKEIYGNDHSEVATYMGNLALLYDEMSRYREAEELYVQALVIKEKSFGKMNRGYASVLTNYGYVKQMTGEYAKAKDIFLQSLKIREFDPGKESMEYAGSLHSLGFVSYYLQEYKESESYYLQALALIEKLSGKQKDYAITINGLGILYNDLGLHAKAIAYHQEAMQIREKYLGKTHPEYLNSLNNLAVAYENTGQYIKAEALYKERLKIEGELYGKNTIEYAITLGNLGLLYYDADMNEKAEDMMKESIGIYNILFGKENDKVSIALANLAGVYKKQRRYEEAERLYLQALEIRGNTFGKGHNEYGYSLETIASLYTEQGKYEKAEPYYIEMLKIRAKKIRTVFPILSEDEKEQFYKVASISFSSFYGYGMSRYPGNHAIASDMYNYRLITKAILLSELNKTRNLVQNSKDSSLIKLYEGWKEKQAQLAQAYKMNEAQRKTEGVFVEKLENEVAEADKKVSAKLTAMGKYIEPKNISWTDIQKKLKPGEAAVELIQTYRQKNSYVFSYIGRGFKYDSVYNDHVVIREIFSERTPASQAGLKPGDKIVRINGVETKGKTVPVLNKLFADSVVTLVIQPKNSPDTEKTVSIKSDSVFKYVVDYPTCYAALIVTPLTKNQPDMVILENGKDMEERYFKFYKNSIKFKTDDTLSYHYFWKPIAAKLQGINKVYVSPDGLYNKINLNTLYNPKTSKYLIEEMRIQLVTNTKDLLSFSASAPINSMHADLFGFPNYRATGAELAVAAANYKSNAEPTEQKTYLAMADVTDNLERSGIEDLPGTKAEIETISTLIGNMKKGKTTVYLQNNAIEEAIKSVDSPQLLHIATHGFFETSDSSTGNPLMRSGLLLAGAESAIRNKGGQTDKKIEDGILTAYEAMSLNLENTELVVLSACETGLGEVKSGEGVYGLQRSFIVAGTKALVISLWKVNDEATQKLMTGFYKNWLGGMNKKEAFNAAQMSLKKEFSSPYYWGAFIMIGN